MENKWFNIDDFMEYIHEEFPEPLKNHFTYDLVENIINYVIDQVDETDEFISIIIKIIPEVTENEYRRFFYSSNN